MPAGGPALLPSVRAIGMGRVDSAPAHRLAFAYDIMSRSVLLSLAGCPPVPPCVVRVRMAYAKESVSTQALCGVTAGGQMRTNI